MSELSNVDAAPANIFGKFGDVFSGGKKRKNKRTNKRIKGGDTLSDFVEKLPTSGGKKRRSNKNTSKRRKTHRKSKR